MNRINKELLYGARNYKPLNLNICAKYIYVRQREISIWTFSRIFVCKSRSRNQTIIKAAIKQMNKLTLTSRFTTISPARLNIITTFQYVKYRNTGVEAGETAVKLARLWGYKLNKYQKMKLLYVLRRIISGEEHCSNKFIKQ